MWAVAARVLFLVSARGIRPSPFALATAAVLLLPSSNFEVEEMPP
jgi:hypothetical protein